MSQSDYLAAEKELIRQTRSFDRANPAVSTAFANLVREASAEGETTKLTKELIALGIAIAIRCEGCLLFHVRALVRLGVTRQQIVETIGVAIEMGGGPAKVYGSHALAIFDAMAAPQPS